MKKYNIAIVGATGLVGSTFLEVLKEYNFPINNLRLLASKRSAGKIINYCGVDYIVEELNEDSFEDIEIALFSAGGDISLKYAKIATSKGAWVIDNSSAWRNDDEIPLIVPEVNFSDYKMNTLIANPNCSTIQVMLPLKALDDKYGVNRVFYSTYQAVSGSGIKGVNDLNDCLKGQTNSFYPYDISKTCIPQIDVVSDENYTKEEMKMVWETRKILHKPNLLVSATCIRVPISNSHGVSVMCELDKDFDLVELKTCLAEFVNIKVVDDLSSNLYPTSLLSNGNDYVYVGRIRKDLGSKNGVLFYCTADNIRKGAASNAVQIAMKLIENAVI